MPWSFQPLPITFFVTQNRFIGIRLEATCDMREVHEGDFSSKIL